MVTKRAFGINQHLDRAYEISISSIFHEQNLQF